MVFFSTTPKFCILNSPRFPFILVFPFSSILIFCFHHPKILPFISLFLPTSFFFSNTKFQFKGQIGQQHCTQVHKKLQRQVQLLLMEYHVPPSSLLPFVLSLFLLSTLPLSLIFLHENKIDQYQIFSDDPNIGVVS